jgi:hypothetical protein
MEMVGGGASEFMPLALPIARLPQAAVFLKG